MREQLCRISQLKNLEVTQDTFISVHETATALLLEMEFDRCI